MDPRARGLRVLLVDDEPDQIDLYRYGLEDAGFVVLPAERGAIAIARARADLPDVIVLDLKLPDIDGWQVCATLKSDEATAHIPIVMLTAAASLTLGDEAARAGCAAHLLKPCYPSDLAETILRVLEADPPPFGV